jgi:hypothetical protein
MGTSTLQLQSDKYFPCFRISLILILLGAFLAFSSLDAGSGKQMQKPLGAHQERILIAMKENTAVLIYRPNYEPLIAFPALENSTS